MYRLRLKLIKVNFILLHSNSIISYVVKIVFELYPTHHRGCSLHRRSGRSEVAMCFSAILVGHIITYRVYSGFKAL